MEENLNAQLVGIPIKEPRSDKKRTKRIDQIHIDKENIPNYSLNSTIH